MDYDYLFGDEDNFYTAYDTGGYLPPTDAPGGFEEWLQYMTGAGMDAPGATDLPDDTFWESLAAAGFDYDPTSGTYWFDGGNGGAGTMVPGEGMPKSAWDKVKDFLSNLSGGSGNSSAGGKSGTSGLSNLASATGSSAAASAISSAIVASAGSPAARASVYHAT